MLSWFYRGEIETRRYTVIISSLMGACSRVRTAGLRLPKAHRSPSASPQPWGAPLPPPFPESLAVSQGSCWGQWILLLCLVLFLTPNEVSNAESCKAPSEIHPLDGKLWSFVLHEPSQASGPHFTGCCANEELSLTTTLAEDVVSKHNWRTIESSSLLAWDRSRQCNVATENYKINQS